MKHFYEHESENQKYSMEFEYLYPKVLTSAMENAINGLQKNFNFNEILVAVFISQ